MMPAAATPSPVAPEKAVAEEEDRTEEEPEHDLAAFLSGIAQEMGYSDDKKRKVAPPPTTNLDIRSIYMPRIPSVYRYVHPFILVDILVTVTPSLHSLFRNSKTRITSRSPTSNLVRSDARPARPVPCMHARFGGQTNTLAFDAGVEWHELVTKRCLGQIRQKLAELTPASPSLSADDDDDAHPQPPSKSGPPGPPPPPGPPAPVVAASNAPRGTLPRAQSVLCPPPPPHGHLVTT